ncbi:DUF924 family protein [Aquabacter spiritensis]|uniref:Uncharacterized protein (DUF924 family) n=1 Tax=Aquabacter spiritensis TaxID=933073 RepID=A0A4R3LS42_9HYPH|nr:DUF924 family protein [Aquabacter spiritensis]TCT03161.1 uncharacterized protein (DUF924 family) [Aquabacter spiritensis]
MKGLPSPAEILAFWRDAGRARWFTADPDFDAAIRDRLLPAYRDAVARGAGAAPLPDYEGDAVGALALVLLLDQVPRNVFRGTPDAFATDAAARQVADRALARGFDAATDPDLRSFFYVPFMHSEALADQVRCVALYAAIDDPDGLEYAEIHRDIIARFGRFPHRNPILGRDMTPEEARFLSEGGFAG